MSRESRFSELKSPNLKQLKKFKSFERHRSAKNRQEEDFELETEKKLGRALSFNEEKGNKAVQMKCLIANDEPMQLIIL